MDEVGLGVWREERLAYLEGFLNDVTDRVRAEEALCQAQQALIDLQQKKNERVKAELERFQHHLAQSTKLATIGTWLPRSPMKSAIPWGDPRRRVLCRRKMPATETRAP